MVNNTIYVIWNKATRNIIFQYTNHLGIPQKAFFTKQARATDAIACLVNNDRLEESQLEVKKIKTIQ